MKSKATFVLAVLVLGLALPASFARAQSFRLNTFRAAERADDGFAVRRLGTFDHLRWGVLVNADYAHDPLVIEQRQGDRSELARVVVHQLTLKLDLSLALWRRLIVFAGMDLVPVMHGPRVPDEFMVPKADGGGMGDLGFGARVRIWGDSTDLFSLGAQATLLAPTAGNQSYRGDEGVAFRPELIAELRPKPVRISFNLGTYLRKQQQLMDDPVGSQLTYALGLGWQVIPRLELLGELWGSFNFKDFGSKTTTPVEWLLGAKYRSEMGLYLGLAAGRGFTRGIGSPDARVVAQLGYMRPAPAPRTAAKPAPVPATAPVITPLPAAEPPPTPRDRDGDTVVDASDACPDQPEDLDDFQDADGCADLDNDSDAVLDVEDACPAQAGVVEERGCPAKPQWNAQGELAIVQQVRFQVNASVILEESLPSMEAVRAALEQHPEIALLRIEGHTDSVGRDDANLTLSQRRAAAVGVWLVQRGIVASRLVAYGCGEQHPVATAATPAGQAENRRVAFQVVEPAPADTARVQPPAGCVAAPIEPSVQ
ncbi:MAG TPA: OmpA family protein [Polyangiales bacterium]